MTQTPNQPEREAEATPDNDIDKLVESLGDICHERYTGCTRTDRLVNEWDYSYTDEVINMLADPRAKTALIRNRDIYAVKARIDEHGVLEALGVGPFPLRLAELRAELATLEGNDHD